MSGDGSPACLRDNNNEQSATGRMLPEMSFSGFPGQRAFPPVARDHDACCRVSHRPARAARQMFDVDAMRIASGEIGIVSGRIGITSRGSLHSGT
jgi:hypothetical protein